jgi:hypothetical protein
MGPARSDGDLINTPAGNGQQRGWQLASDWKKSPIFPIALEMQGRPGIIYLVIRWESLEGR